MEFNLERLEAEQNLRYDKQFWKGIAILSLIANAVALTIKYVF